ncbi:hypothetical protein ABZX62_04080 [Streptomyces flavidovirens]|uniref:hypothetical protein n=1 Tax=Streptomyces flavidovirens TaxID=67298 RepID=UPI0033ADE51C
MTAPPDEPVGKRRRWPRDGRTDRYDWELARGRITALGESKTLRAWAADERCAVSREALRTRLALGWEPAAAITTPRHDKPDMKFTYAERTLSLRGWADQSGIAYHTLYNRIRQSGMTFAEALEKGGDGPHFTLHVTAFGETKPLSHWAVDHRANCSYTTIRRRLAEGWDPEQAITEEPHQRSTLGTGVPHRAFGLSMGLEDWARHTQIPASHLRKRMDQYGLPVEAALTSLGWTPHSGVPTEQDLLRIPAAQLQPGDHILGVEQSGADQQFLTVRRSGASAAPPDAAPHRTIRAQRASTATTPIPPRPSPSRTPHARR